MHIHKTGALIRASVQLGALCQPDVNESTLQTLDHYAKCIGLAFQIQDDILDEEGDTDTLGKTSGADRALDKPTYPALIGLEESRQMARELTDDAYTSLEQLPDYQTDLLQELAKYIISRPN